MKNFRIGIFGLLSFLFVFAVVETDGNSFGHTPYIWNYIIYCVTSGNNNSGILPSDDDVTDVADTSPWYKSMKWNSNDIDVEYTIPSGTEPDQIVYHDIYAGGQATTQKDIIEALPEYLKIIEMYNLDLNGDGQRDVTHVVEYFPTQYLKNSVLAVYSNNGNLHAVLNGLLILVRQGDGVGDTSLKRPQLIVVKSFVDVDKDGRPDYEIRDITHPVKDGSNDNFGGDGIADYALSFPYSDTNYAHFF